MYVSRQGEYRDAVAAARPQPNVGFLLIGGDHQLLHLAPVAVALARRGEARVHLFALSEDDASSVRRYLAQSGIDLEVEVLPTPSWARPLPRLRPDWAMLKLPRLFAGRRRLGEMDVLVTAERTSTMLKRLPGWRGQIVHIPHGAGDRARGFEPRIRLCDHVIVAGPKDRERMIAEGLVRPEACSVSGYVKLAAVLATHRKRLALFDNGRPTILYSPHFAADLSSWETFGERLAAVVTASATHNLVIAPHVRLAAKLSPGERRAIEALASPGSVIVDLGSARSSDMTYTLDADLYVGDVSSQVYEFLHRPRPCLFLNATGADRRGDPSFAFWRLGEVIDDPADLAAAIARAAARHPEFAAAQRRAVRDAFGPPGIDAAAEAARIIGMLVTGRGTVASSQAA